MTRQFLLTTLLGAALVLPAAAQSRYTRDGTPPAPTPTPAPVVPTPPPSNPPPVVTPPPTAPVYSTPLLLGQSSSGQIETLNAVFSALSSQISNFNNSSPFDLGQAALNGASQTVVVPSTTAPATTNTGGARYSRGESSPTPPPAPTGPTSLDIDVTGWSYLVLQWGDTNYHFYVGDTTGLKTFSGSAPLSSYTFFTSAAGQPPSTSVPETLSTFAALSFAAALLGAAARRWGRKQ